MKLTLISSFILVFGLFAIFVSFIVIKGISALNLDLIFKNEDGIQKGIFPTIINTIYVEILTLLIATPIGIGTSIYLTQYKKESNFTRLVNFLIKILASIPSILLGLFGYNIFCLILGLKPSILAGCLTLTFCILPNIVETSKEALKSVPKSYKEGSLALGAGKFKTIFNLILPCATPGILTAIILSAGKIIGESAALLLTIGTANKLPQNFFNHIFKSGKTLTLHLYFTAGNATLKNSVNICFAIATILIFLIFILNCLTKLVTKFFKK